MAIGSNLWRVNRTIFLCAALLFAAPLSAYAQIYELDWRDRDMREDENGDIFGDPPFVKINGVALSRFTDMAHIDLFQTLDVDGLYGSEQVFVFTVWQGGAGQGQQIMLVTLSDAGVDLIGPHDQNFETVEIVPANADQGPLFLLYGDGDGPIAEFEYFSGQLIELNE